MANANRRRSTLGKIKINGVCLTKETEIKEGIVRAFQNLLSKLEKWHLSIKGYEFWQVK